MSPNSPAAVISAAQVGDLGHLEPLARAIFGTGDRPKAWFGRKLARECVDPALSVLMTTRPEAPADQSAWLGYALLGAPPSCRPLLRSAGIGLIPQARGAGLGRTLVAAMFEAAQRAGAAGVRTTALASAAAFYERHGYVRLRDEVTLMAFGDSPAANAPVSKTGACTLDWTPNPNRQQRVHGQWLREAWDRTPAKERIELRLSAQNGEARALISREGVAWVCHRLLADEACSTAELAAALAHWRNLHSPTTPLILLGLAPGAAITHALTAGAWTIAQASVVCERRFHAP